MSAQQRRVVSFAGSAVAIEWRDPRAAALVNFLFQRAPENGGIPAQITYNIDRDHQRKRWSLYRNGRLVYRGECEATLAEILLGETCHHLADRSRDGLLFHAAGLAWGEKGLLLPGGIAAGKSTLAAWLATRGFEYLTDELVFVPQGADRMQTFARPLNLKSASRIVLRNALEGNVTRALRGDQADLILPKSAGAPRELPLSLVIFPRYQPEGDFILDPLSKAQAGLALMQCLINARNLSDHGFSEIARLAKITTAYAMRYGDLRQIEFPGNWEFPEH